MTINDLRKGRYSISGQDYFVTFATKNRVPYFNSHRVSAILAKEIERVHNVQMLAWVIMPDHVHLLFTLQTGSLASVISTIKGRSSRLIGTNCCHFKWAKGYFDRSLRREECRISVARYIIANPLRAGLVDNIGNYPWWNASYL